MTIEVGLPLVNIRYRFRRAASALVFSRVRQAVILMRPISHADLFTPTAENTRRDAAIFDAYAVAAAGDICAHHLSAQIHAFLHADRSFLTLEQASAQLPDA